MVTSVNRSYPIRNINAHDFGFYLNKNDIVIQFNEMSVKQCLTMLFNKVGISIGYICDMPAKVTMVYIKNVNNIIKELIKIQSDNDGKKYHYELRGKNIHVFQLTDTPINYIFKPTINVSRFDITDKDAHGRGQYKHSIEDMNNRIKAIINSRASSDMPAMEYTISDDDSIKKYGLLASNYVINSEEYENIKSLAKNRLKERNKLKRELLMDFIGHSDARAGRVMHIVDEVLGINDYFRIQSVNHKINAMVHKMSCTLEFVEEVVNNNLTESELTQREDVKTFLETTSKEIDNYENLYSVLKQQLGKRYVWGATGPNSFDCSGLVYYCFNKSNTKKIPRLTAQGYYESCTKVSSKNKQAGDLIFWAKEGRVYHVAVFIGNGMMIGAQNPQIGVVKTKVTKDVFAYGRL